MLEHVAHHSATISEVFMKYPIFGSVLSVILVVSGYFIPNIMLEVPVVYMQSIQIFVWCLAGVASILTIKGHLKKK